jgi:hypothetical protein
MQRFMLHGTVHRATVTAADLHHVGSAVPVSREPRPHGRRFSTS